MDVPEPHLAPLLQCRCSKAAAQRLNGKIFASHPCGKIPVNHFPKNTTKGLITMAKKQNSSAEAAAAPHELPSDANAAQAAGNGKPPVAVQLYTLRSLKQPPAELLEEIAAIGYAGVELAGTFAPGMPPADLRKLLDAAGLQVVSAHVSINDLEADLPGAVRAQKILGNDTLIVPWVSEEMRGKTADSWKALGARLARLAKRSEHAGMRFMYHNHDFEMVVIDGRPAIDWLMEGAAQAAPANVGFEMDLAWVQHGGQDVSTLLGRYAGRVSRVHAKDLAQDPTASPEEKGLATVGQGKLDWDTILPAAKAAGVEWYIVEHDFPVDPLASIRSSYEFLAGKVG
jgi:sugar phosphate isomerase/epimerase